MALGWDEGGRNGEVEDRSQIASQILERPNFPNSKIVLALAS